MASVFIVCAALGGTILVLQFLLTLAGIGGHAFDLDAPDISHGFGGDFHGDVGGHLHGGTDHDANADHHSIQLFKILSFRTIVAALAFFGLCGLASQSAGFSNQVSLLTAVVCGGIAMVTVYWIMQGLQNLRDEGTARIENAVGEHGSIYLNVPGDDSGCGKVQLNLQNRTMEYLAVTSGPALPTGTKVVVVND
jgi:hypothetical protein